MSTKSTLVHGKNFHLYHEGFDEYPDVYLELRGDVEFEASQGAVMVRIPIAIWEVIRKHGGFVPEYHQKTDEEIRALVEKRVDERIAEWQAAPAHAREMRAMFGAWTYGSASDPRDKQIQAGVESITRERQRELEIQAQIEAVEAHE